MEEIYQRAGLLLGDDVMEALGSLRVIVFGIGGVGSWCAEGLLRDGVRHLTIVDSDCVDISNVNRQLEATMLTVGRPKVEVMKERLLEINARAEVTALEKSYSDDTCEEFALDSYDVVIDAIDSLKDKISLLLRASRTHAKVYSSMGAALKVDPTRVRVAEFWDVRGCPLGALLRKKMRKEGVAPASKIMCVYDEEVLEGRGEPIPSTDVRKAVTNGSLVHITAIYGMTLCGLVVKDVYASVINGK